jgi:cobalt-zinc-cadmium efflux system outer membrane protein
MKRFLILLAAAGCAAPPPEIPSEPAALTSPPAPAPQEPPRVLTLEAALALADESHPDLAEARARFDAARGRAIQAGAWPNPSAIARVEAAGSEVRPEYLAGVSQAFPIGRRLGSAERVERLEAERLELEFEARRRTVRSRVQAAFAGALFARQAFALHQETAADAERAVEVARTLVAAGDATTMDVSRARIELALARLHRDRAESHQKSARIALSAAIGRDVGEVEGALEAAIELPALEKLARDLESHPVLRAARADVRAQEARMELVRSLRIPDVNVEVLYRRSEEFDEDSFDAGIAVALPIFDRGRGRMREARAERRAAEARAQSSALNLSRDLQAAHLRLSRALASSRTLKEELVTPQEEIVRSFEVRYSAGDASLSEVLPARRDMSAARLDYLETLREVLEAWAVLAGFMN